MSELSCLHVSGVRIWKKVVERKEKSMKRRQMRLVSLAAAVLTGASLLLSGCGGSSSQKKEEAPAAEAVAEEPAAEEQEAAEAEAPAEEAAEAPASESGEEVTVIMFAAKSLNTVMDDIIATYQETHPGVTIVPSYDSSGTLQTQIQEGAACDVFFSAAQKQMNTLEEGGFVVEGTRHNVVNNQVVVVTYPDSGTTVTGLEDLSNAANMALADGSVPVGKYTRQALVNAGIVAEPADGDVSKITSQEVSEALGGLEINECGNVGQVASAVAEGSNEVGTVYYSDTYGLEDKLVILQTVSYDLTGNVIYPIAQINNEDPSCTDAERAAAAEFVEYVASEEAKAVFQKYYFDTDVE